MEDGLGQDAVYLTLSRPALRPAILMKRRHVIAPIVARYLRLLQSQSLQILLLNIFPRRCRTQVSMLTVVYDATFAGLTSFLNPLTFPKSGLVSKISHLALFRSQAKGALLRDQLVSVGVSMSM